MDNPTYDMRIDLAIADLSEQVKPNYSATAKRFDVERTTLRRRFQGEQASRAVANSEHRQCLSNLQEKTLIEHINMLTD